MSRKYVWFSAMSGPVIIDLLIDHKITTILMCSLVFSAYVLFAHWAANR